MTIAALHSPIQTRAFVTLVSFTAAERDVLMHRLSIPECIADALTDRADDEEPAPYTWNEARDAADLLGDSLLVVGTVSVVTALDRDILQEAVDGSTWGNVTNDMADCDEITKAERGRRWRIMHAIERKLIRCGLEAEFPNT